MNVQAKFISTEGPYLEATILVDEVSYIAMDCFSEGSSRTVAPGELVSLELLAGLTDEEESWDSIFNGNPKNLELLKPVEGWKYRAYGRIVRLDPVEVKCGGWTFEAPFSTHDLKVIGAYVAFTITRLDAYCAELNCSSIDIEGVYKHFNGTWIRHGELFLVHKESAIHFAKYLFGREIVLLGIDGLILKNDSTESPIDWIVDYSRLSPSYEDVAGWLKRASEHVTHFEFVLKL